MRRLALPLAGSAILVAFSIAALPFSRGLFRLAQTPYDVSDSKFTRPAWMVLAHAEPLIPRGAVVLVRTHPSDPTNDSYLHRYAVALLPGRKIAPAALWGVPTAPDLARGAEYEVVVGEMPSTRPGQLLLEISEGSVWRRER